MAKSSSTPEEVRCFQHCDRYTNIFCFSVPRRCPICENDTSRTPTRIPPYVLPSPFVRASDYPCAVVIRPTHGTFLRDYNNLSYLHVGITDTRGVVYDYDEDGVHIGNNSWDQCVAVPLQKLGLTREVWQNWDQCLLDLSRHGLWTKLRYNIEDHNCFDFAIRFLKNVGFNRENVAANSKLAFTQTFVIPYTMKAGQYISIYRDVVRNGYKCQTVT